MDMDGFGGRKQDTAGTEREEICSGCRHCRLSLTLSFSSSSLSVCVSLSSFISLSLSLSSHHLSLFLLHFCHLLSYFHPQLNSTPRF